MDKGQKFVFLSRKRWRKVKLSLGALFLITIAYFVIVYLGLTQTFNKTFLNNDPKPIIDDISTRVPDKIETVGEGPIVKLGTDNGYYLKKIDPKPSKKVFLTFDDGPDPVATEEILKVLKKENVRATFFTIGENLYKYPQVAKKVTEQGNLISPHTFTHSPEQIDLYDQNLRMFLEFELTQRFIEDISGYSSKIFRIPYSGTDQNISMNALVLAANAHLRGYQIVGSTIDSNDWFAKTPEEIISAVAVQQQELNSTPVILLHDGGGNRKNTILALPRIINYYRFQGYQFETVDSLFVPGTMVTQIASREKILASSVVAVYKLLRNFPQIISSIFVLGLLSFGLHSVLVTFFAILHKLKPNKKMSKYFRPKVSIIIPAFNEEKVIQKTVCAAIAQDYPNLEIVVINDGSTDKTKQKLAKLISDHNIKVFWQANQGKYSAINSGLRICSGRIVVVVDADTQILPQTVSYLVKHFRNRKIAAVSGHVKVGNQKSLLTCLQEIDYRTSLHLERRAFDYLNSIFVVPGAIGAWRKSAVRKVGGFSPATITEDAELGLRLKKAGYKIIFEPKAIGLTEVPITLKSLIKQRFRWTFGIFQTLWLHKDMVFRMNHGILGMIILPYIIFIQIPSMVMATFIELAAIPIALFVSLKLVIVSLIVLLAGRFLLFAIASALAGEGLALAPYIIPYRFFYQFLLYFIIDAAIFTALKGVYVSWQKLPHFGLVDIKTFSKSLQLTSSDSPSVK